MLFIENKEKVFFSSIETVHHLANFNALFGNQV